MTRYIFFSLICLLCICSCTLETTAGFTSNQLDHSLLGKFTTDNQSNKEEYIEITKSENGDYHVMLFDGKQKEMIPARSKEINGYTVLNLIHEKGAHSFYALQKEGRKQWIVYEISELTEREQQPTTEKELIVMLAKRLSKSNTHLTKEMTLLPMSS